MVMAAAVLLVLSGILVDASGLEQEVGSWDFTTISMLLVVFYGWVPLLLTAVVALGSAQHGRELRRWALAGSLVTTVLGALMIVIGLASVIHGPSGQSAWGACAAAIGAVLQWPMLAWWRGRGSAHAPDQARAGSLSP